MPAIGRARPSGRDQPAAGRGERPEHVERDAATGLVALHEAGHLEDEEFAFLRGAYLTLRAIEGRLRLLDAVDRHDFPSDPADQRKLAHLLGYVDTESLVADVRDTTSRVRAEFNAVFDEAMA